MFGMTFLEVISKIYFLFSIFYLGTLNLEFSCIWNEL